ncbi:MAG TPA: hypothetical protein VJ986_12550 [Gaiellaceae bacterium]|nr:hypothetical protein [Gaiellaceae bacterium]
MEAFTVECLRCGTTRPARRTVWRHVESCECPRCGYLGWAPSADLSETERRTLRERSVEHRRLRVA